ncbi:MAG TPA: DUF1634 domain-containing protein [Terriglobales bacterium]|nr:DUF1634 domain-containing protein [Terriglobales bacterium]
MTNRDTSWNDYKIEQIIGVLLRVGVSVSALIVFVAGSIYLSNERASRTHYDHFHEEGTQLTTISGVIHQAITAEPLAIIQLGLLLLIATPVARVLFAAFAFMLERDWMYVAVSLIVFTVLMATLTGLVI